MTFIVNSVRTLLVLSESRSRFSSENGCELLSNEIEYRERKKYVRYAKHISQLENDVQREAENHKKKIYWKLISIA